MSIDLKRLRVDPTPANEESRYRALMRQHHYLGDLPKIGHTLWYVATYDQQWVALVSFSGSSLKCAARDTWIGWESRHQYGRLKLIANNSRFLILPDWHLPNVGSKVLALCQRRIQADWLAHFKQPLLLLETFVDPTRYAGTVYKAANWHRVGQTQGSRRIRGGYSAKDGTPKLVFVSTLQANARFELSRPVMHPRYRQESPQNHAQARTHGCAAVILQRHCRPAPRSGTAPPAANRAGPGRRGHAVRHGRLQGHGWVGQ